MAIKRRFVHMFIRKAKGGNQELVVYHFEKNQITCLLSQQNKIRCKKYHPNGVTTPFASLTDSGKISPRPHAPSLFLFVLRVHNLHSLTLEHGYWGGRVLTNQFTGAWTHTTQALHNTGQTIYGRMLFKGYIEIE